MPGDYAQLADQRDDLRAATNPLPVPLRQDDGSGVFPIVTSHDFSTDPDDEQGPFFDVSTALFAVLEVCPARSMFHRTFTYEIVSGFDPEQTFAVEINGVTYHPLTLRPVAVGAERTCMNLLLQAINDMRIQS